AIGRMIAAGRLSSMILWGPPGTGKTSTARLLADAVGMRFVAVSAVFSGVADLKKAFAEADVAARAGQRTLLFVDEIHRFNRAQQDAFLPFVERGEIVLVGATTENPSFELNAALLSRCRVVVLAPLSTAAIRIVIARALADRERGLGASGVTLDAEAVAAIATLASGDARRALNLVEAVVAEARSAGQTAVSAASVQALAQRKVLLYDKAGEEHFNLISALHKSLRESDPDAGLYWLARMLEAGEEPLYVARRLVRFAVEDVGLADPRALTLGIAAWEAYHRLGSPEGELALAELVVYLALAPKSVSVYRAWSAVRRAVAEHPAEPVPMAIRNAPTRLLKE
ncbi:MAG TPA: replication-associated recombination protein A, partial [Thermoanaerobaculia bacterium]|nr:replication-associated recombination protein A [Thermoanaerobaculia bacterium]